MLDGQWSNYEKTEDGILKRAYMSGHKRAKYTLRGNRYEYDFIRMKQKNLQSARERDIRPPHNMKPPSKPLIPSGPTLVVKVPPCSAGTVIQVPHPSDKSQMICVKIPGRARVGQSMIVPVPPLSTRPSRRIPTPASASVPPTAGLPVPSAPPAPAVETKPSFAKAKCRKDVTGVALGGVALAGGVVAGGALAGDALLDGALHGVIDPVDVGFDDIEDWAMDVGADTGDFLMDLF